MKKVLIMTSGLTHGGVNRTLLNSLEVMNSRGYKFEIFTLYSYGPYLDMFKEYDLLTIFEVWGLFRLLNRAVSKNTKIAIAIRRFGDFIVKVIFHLFHSIAAKSIANALSKLGADVVISFQEGVTTEIISLVEAKKHIAWVHCDYSRYVDETHRDESVIYNRYSQIVCVSEYTASVFRSIIPLVKDRVVAIHNIMDTTGIKHLSCVDIRLPYDNDVVNLVSIGRLDPVKRFSFIPGIAKQLKDTNLAFRWYIIGDGGAEKNKVLNNIIEYSVQNEVILLGEIDNPYPYIRNASALVCLSRSEACPNVINEARILHTPIVTTDFPSVKEYIINGKNGLISSIDNIHTTINDLFHDNKIFESIKNNIKTYNYDNEAIVNEIDSILSI